MLSFDQLKSRFPGDWQLRTEDIFYLTFEDGTFLYYDWVGFWHEGNLKIIDIEERLVKKFIKTKTTLSKFK